MTGEAGIWATNSNQVDHRPKISTITFAGVAASRFMAKRDLERMDRFKEKITKVGKELKVDPAVIAGKEVLERWRKRLLQGMGKGVN